MLKVGEQVSVRAISKKGRERVRSYGPDGWTIRKIEDFIDAIPGQEGPWLLLEPKFGATGSRWVHSTMDKHLVVYPHPAGGLAASMLSIQRGA